MVVVIPLLEHLVQEARLIAIEIQEQAKSVGRPQLHVARRCAWATPGVPQHLIRAGQLVPEAVASPGGKRLAEPEGHARLIRLIRELLRLHLSNGRGFKKPYIAKLAALELADHEV